MQLSAKAIQCLVSIVLMLPLGVHASSNKRDDLINDEVRRFWLTQMESGESAVIDQIKSCYAGISQLNPSMSEADKCIIWDIALTNLSLAFSQAISERNGQTVESIQTPFTRVENMSQRVIRLLQQFGFSQAAASNEIKLFSEKIAAAFEHAYKEADARTKTSNRNLYPWEMDWSGRSRKQEDTKREASADLLEVIAKSSEDSSRIDSESHLLIGTIYGDEKSPHKDLALAVKHFHLSADQGNAKAQYNLGVAYGNGFGVLQDHVEAAKWFSLSAEQGLPSAYYALGIQYRDGLGVKRNLSVAYALFSLASMRRPPGIE